MRGGLIGLIVCGCATETARPSGEFVELPGIGSTRIDVPRPTTAGGESCATAVPAGESISERVVALRDIGLFVDRTGQSDAELAAEIEDEIGALWGPEGPPDDLYAELSVAERDVDRVWWMDLEADVLEENQVYVSTLNDWARISVGAFEPTAISEAWRSATGPVDVSFTQDGARHVLTADYLEDWIDPRILTPLNDIIAPSGRQFALFKAFDQTAFVMALTPDEHSALEARGWCFE